MSLQTHTQKPGEGVLCHSSAFPLRQDLSLNCGLVFSCLDWKSENPSDLSTSGSLGAGVIREHGILYLFESCDCWSS